MRSSRALALQKRKASHRSSPRSPKRLALHEEQVPSAIAHVAAARSWTHRRITPRRDRISEAALGLSALAATALPPHTASMPRPKKGTRRSRINGSKASNKGKLKSEPVAIININYGARSAAGGITFEKVLRAQLHKNEKYLDELRAEEQLGVAARVVRARYLPGCGPDKPGSMSCEVARAILAAYREATEGQM